MTSSLVPRRRTPGAPDVWLQPPAGRSAGDFARGLRDGDVHMVVVPRTGSRRADVAVLLDPDPDELASIHRMLPRTPLLAVTSAAPSAGQADAARRTGARLLAGATPARVLAEIRALRPGGDDRAERRPRRLPDERQPDAGKSRHGTSRAAGSATANPSHGITETSTDT